MGLTGIAYGKGTIKNPAFPCGRPRSVAVAGLPRHLGRSI
jgi:hypothetical protein